MALEYFYLDDLDSALKNVYEGRRIAEDLGIEFRLSFGYFAESLIREELNFRPRVATGNFYLGELHNNFGQKEEALRHLKTAVDMFEDMGVPYFIDKTKKLLAAA
jgi:hypothetical protein